MTDNIIKNVVIDILGKSYTVKCSESEAELLQQSAKCVDKEMRGLKESGKALNLDRLAIMTALHMAYQLLILQKEKESSMQSIHQRINELQEKLGDALDKNAQTEFLYTE
ncbi:MAG: hypothetical protein A3E83_02285 [Gammaproteobacteria bacterium RIFCSPHIGHO2_12_FULL_41_20]|nr:MAG: hypothetical protein A3E83_02285 [Gammaproteobacteria bacterium RIFCSPHIGHO2_12_FULL_41_20]